MAPETSIPFKPGAPNPMMGDETNDEWDEDDKYATESILGPQAFEYDAYDTQECMNGSTIDPRLLQSQSLHSTPLGPGVFTDPTLDTSTPEGLLTGSPMDYFRVRMSDISIQAEDHTSAIDSSSPVSFSLSDVSSSDFNYENNGNNINQAGPSTADSLLEPLPSLGVGVESPYPNMVKPFACGRCSKSFEKQYQLNRHIGWHDKPIECPKPGCIYRAQYNKDVERHIWGHHAKWAEETGRPQIRKECKICKVILERPDNVKRHMDEVHSGRKRKRGPKG
ncbi:hypothetical protein V8C37DRAFT_414677 [Trichoderma ceciliae]